MLALSTLLNRLAFRFKIDLSAEVGTQARKRPDLALAEHKRRGHLLPPEVLRFCRDRTS